MARARRGADASRRSSGSSRVLVVDGRARRAPDRRRAARAARLPAPGGDARAPLVDDLAVTTNGFLLERDAAALVEAGRQPLQRLDRLAAARPLLRDDPPRRAATACCAGLEALAAFPRGAPDQGQRGRRCAASPRTRCSRSRASPASTRTRCASSSSCRSTPTAPGTLDQVLTGDGDPRRDRRGLPARARAARAAAPPPASTASPTARAGSASSTRSPSRSAATATASA